MIETGFPGQNPSDRIEHSEPTQQDITIIAKDVVKRIQKEKDERNKRFDNEKFVPYEKEDIVLTKNHVQKYPRYNELEVILDESKIIRAAADLKPYQSRPEETCFDTNENTSDDETVSVSEERSSEVSDFDGYMYAIDTFNPSYIPEQTQSDIQIRMST